MIRTTAGLVSVGSPMLQPVPVELRGGLELRVAMQGDGNRMILRPKPVAGMRRRDDFTYIRG